MVQHGYVVRAVNTFDDVLLMRRSAANLEMEEDQISPKSTIDFQEKQTMNKRNASMISKSSTSSLRSTLKRNLSDSQLMAHINKPTMHSWKCNLCFYNNLNTTETVCSMCGTNMDASFMAALNALDNLKDPSVHNDEDNNIVVYNDDDEDFECEKKSDVPFLTSFTENNVSFRTAEDATLVSYQTAQQAPSMGADVSTIHPETYVTGMDHGEDDNENDPNLANNNNFGEQRKNSWSSKSGVLNTADRLVSLKDAVLKTSDNFVDASLNSSIAMPNQNSTVLHASILDVNQPAQHTSKTSSIEDDSIHTLLSATHPEEEEVFDPMLFQRDDVEMEATSSLCARQDDDAELEELELVSYRYGLSQDSSSSSSPSKDDARLENISGHHFAFEKEIHLDEYIQQSRVLLRKASELSLPRLQNIDNQEEKKSSTTVNKSKSQVQVEIPMGDEQGVIQERESISSRNIWIIRSTVVAAVVVIVAVSIFVIG